MVIGKDRYTPFARPWDEPPCEHACPYGGENQASPKCVHELRPCNLDVGNKRNIAHVRLVDAPVPQRHIGTLHLVETDKVPERSKCLRTKSEEHTSELQSLMRISYAVFCLNKKTKNTKNSQL